MKTTYKSPQVIAEIGCNHKGEIQLAKELIKEAVDSGVEVVKFQKRNNKELLTLEQYNAPHPNPMHSYGDSYGAHREFLEFDVVQHKALKEYAESLGVIYSTSVWDTTSAKEIVSLDPVFIKVPSACNNHFEMLKVLRDHYKGDVHISFGQNILWKFVILAHLSLGLSFINFCPKSFCASQARISSSISQSASLMVLSCIARSLSPSIPLKWASRVVLRTDNSCLTFFNFSKSEMRSDLISRIVILSINSPLPISVIIGWVMFSSSYSFQKLSYC